MNYPGVVTLNPISRTVFSQGKHSRPSHCPPCWSPRGHIICLGKISACCLFGSICLLRTFSSEPVSSLFSLWFPLLFGNKGCTTSFYSVVHNSVPHLLNFFFQQSLVLVMSSKDEDSSLSTYMPVIFIIGKFLVPKLLKLV